MPDENDPPKSRTGARILVDALKVHGVDTIFCVPGESYLAVLDALYDVQDEISLYVCRQEGGAADMAEAYGKLTGRPGVCFVTRGPGATNASVGVHTAQQDSTPLLLFIGQVSRDVADREGFQEIEFRRMFAPLTKWSAQCERADRLPELVSHAFHVATAGRPGPVVLALPEDVLEEEASVADTGRYEVARPSPSREDMARLRELLSSSRRPLVILGGPRWDGAACESIRRFAENNGVPVACAFRFQDLFDNRHPLYAGDVGIGVNPKLAQRVRDADLILAIGPRLGEMTTSGYTLLSVPRPVQKLVHVHVGAEELGRVYQADLLINAAMSQMARALSEMEPFESARWSDWTRSAHEDYLRWTERKIVPGRVQLWDVMDYLRGRLPEDTILTNGGGNFSVWLHRFYRHPRFKTQLGPTSGAMGYGVPAAIAAKAVYRDRTVVAFTGDGDFLMTGQELATAVQYQLDIIVVLINNGMYGTIRMHQERHYPGRVIGSDLVNPDFAAYARAFGAHGEVVEETAQFPPAFERAIASGKPALVEVRIDPQAITPNSTLDELRRQAIQAKR